MFTVCAGGLLQEAAPTTFTHNLRAGVSPASVGIAMPPVREAGTASARRAALRLSHDRTRQCVERATQMAYFIGAFMA